MYCQSLESSNIQPWHGGSQLNTESLLIGANGSGSYIPLILLDAASSWAVCASWLLARAPAAASESRARRLGSAAQQPLLLVVGAWGVADACRRVQGMGCCLPPAKPTTVAGSPGLLLAPRPLVAG